MSKLRDALWHAIADLSHLPSYPHRSDCPGRNGKERCHSACPVFMQGEVVKNLDRAYNELIKTEK